MYKYEAHIMIYGLSLVLQTRIYQDGLFNNYD